MVANLGGGTANSLVYLNGNSVTFAFGSQANNSMSAFQTATVANIGNQSLTLSSSARLLQPQTNSCIRSWDDHHLRQQ